MLPAKWIGATCAAIGTIGAAVVLNAQTPEQSEPVPVFKEEAVSDCEEPITLAAVGDVLLHDAFQEWAAQQAQGYYAAMAPVADLMQAADITVANLEGPAAKNLTGLGREEVATPATIYDGKAYRGYPLFNYHPSIVSDLRKLGVDVLQTANNHSLDRGSLGADRTIDAIDNVGLARTGTRRALEWSKDYDWSATFTVMRGETEYTFAFLACTYGTNGVPDKKGQVLHCYDQRDEVLANIRKLRADPNIAAIVVLPHWGKEYEPLQENMQAGLAQDMAEAGATAIIGTHPHVVQPEAMLTTRDGRTVPVLYSLGNFISRQIGLPRLTTVIYMLGFQPGEDGKLSVTQTGWIPLRMKTEGTMRIDPLDRIPEFEAAPYLAHLLETYSAEKRLAAEPGTLQPKACAAD